MAHLRKRQLEPLLKKSLGWSPVVGVLGPRQSGKTTLLKQLCAESETFDDPSLERRFEASGEAILEAARKPFLLDEVQKYTPIFDLLKLSVDRRRIPGQFLITGSVRFASKKSIRETLTGRAVTWELLPLTLREAHSQGAATVLQSLRGGSLGRVRDALERSAWCRPEQWRSHVKLGGMPGICFMRDSVQRGQALSSLLDTVIERDFYFVRNSKIRPHVLREILVSLVALQGEPLSVSQLARRFRLSAPSMKAILQTFEDLFLVRNHGRALYFEDLGVAEILREEFGGRVPVRDVEALLFSELKAIRAYTSDERVKLSDYRSRGGSTVPFILQSKSVGVVAIAVDEGDELTEKSLKGLYSFKRTSPSARLLHVHGGSRASIHHDRVLSVPVGWVV